MLEVAGGKKKDVYSWGYFYNYILIIVFFITDMIFNENVQFFGYDSGKACTFRSPKEEIQNDIFIRHIKGLRPCLIFREIARSLVTIVTEANYRSLFA